VTYTCGVGVIVTYTCGRRRHRDVRMPAAAQEAHGGLASGGQAPRAVRAHDLGLFGQGPQPAQRAVLGDPDGAG
jgi:hypothetical protein